MKGPTVSRAQRVQRTMERAPWLQCREGAGGAAGGGGEKLEDARS